MKKILAPIFAIALPLVGVGAIALALPEGDSTPAEVSLKDSTDPTLDPSTTEPPTTITQAPAAEAPALVPDITVPPGADPRTIAPPFAWRSTSPAPTPTAPQEALPEAPAPDPGPTQPCYTTQPDQQGVSRYLADSPPGCTPPEGMAPIGG
jgi:hypothetical protein